MSFLEEKGWRSSPPKLVLNPSIEGWCSLGRYPQLPINRAIYRGPISPDKKLCKFYQNLSWLVKAYKEPVPIGCTGLVYLHTWMVDFMENVGKYTDYSNRSYGIKVVAFQEVVKILFFLSRDLRAATRSKFGSKLPWRRNLRISSRRSCDLDELSLGRRKLHEARDPFEMRVHRWSQIFF